MQLHNDGTFSFFSYSFLPFLNTENAKSKKDKNQQISATYIRGHSKVVNNVAHVPLVRSLLFF